MSRSGKPAPGRTTASSVPSPPRASSNAAKTGSPTTHWLSPNHDERPPGVTPDMIVLHYTGMQSAEAALERLCDPQAKVSAHYLVDENGSVLPLVDESKRAWHAGVSGWGTEIGLNDRSIGIELVNPGHEWGYRPFPQKQMDALLALMDRIVDRWRIPVDRVLGHSDIAPARKEDPGELFDWPLLAAAGHALLPQPIADDWQAMSDTDAISRLKTIGYRFDIATFSEILMAFQRHFVPAALGRGLDVETAAHLRATSRVFST